MKNLLLPANDYYAILVSGKDLEDKLCMLLEKMNELGDDHFLKDPIDIDIDLIASATDSAEITFDKIVPDISWDEIEEAGCESILSIINWRDDDRNIAIEANPLCYTITLRIPDEYNPITALITKEDLSKIVHEFNEQKDSNIGLRQ